MNYQKTYMNHIHSSSLLCQLATMWKSQTLCDAIIRSGNNITRAHRVVLVAACPMLQSMENAASGSHLEVRVASDIKVESIHTFLQYLYEGFMTLTEENCKDVEKIARLLQVDGVVKCCADFHKCLNTSSAGQYKYSLLDQIEFRHVRTTDLSKCQDKMQKRQLDTGRMSPGGKRQKVHRPSSPPTDHSMSQRMSDMHSMSESYMPDANDPWDRVPRLGASGARSGSQPGVIDIVEDSLELIQTDPPGKHPGENSFDTRRVQQTVGISVASQHNKGADLQIVNVAEQQAMSSAARPPSDIIPSSPSSSSSSSFKDAMGSSRPPDPRGAAGPPPPPQLQRMDPGRQPSHGTINLVDIPHSPDPEISKQASRQQGRSSEAFPPSSMSSAPPRSGDNFQSSSTPQRPSQPFPVSLTAVPRGGPSFQSKPYAAGSAVQAEASSPRGPRSQSRGDADRASPAERAKDAGPKSTPDMSEGAPDISIVKVERTSSNLAGDTVGGLDMFVSEGGVSLTPVPGVGQGEDDEHSDFELEEPPGEMSKEIDLSNMSNEGGDQSGNWYMGNMKDVHIHSNIVHSEGLPQKHADDISVVSLDVQWDVKKEVSNADFDIGSEQTNPFCNDRLQTSDENRSSLRTATLYRPDQIPRQQSPKRRGPKVQSIRLKLYLVPDGDNVPHLSKQDPMIPIHQSNGYGYPSSHYSDFKCSPVYFHVWWSDEEFKEAIRLLYPKLQGKEFSIYTMDNNRRLKTAPFQIQYFRELKYQGTVIVKIDME